MNDTEMPSGSTTSLPVILLTFIQTILFLFKTNSNFIFNSRQKKENNLRFIFKIHMYVFVYKLELLNNLKWINNSVGGTGSLFYFGEVYQLQDFMIKLWNW